MKRNITSLFKIAVVAAVVAGSTSCESFLTVEPKSSWVTEAFYKNQDEVILGLNGIYSYLGQDATYGQVMSAMF
ncbi:MAG TPA: hypothetical protein PK167_05540, partial [Prolixibacteraceae bacterium]|nr:hypothetical protein [Prolixibacteraceae bacterium]